MSFLAGLLPQGLMQQPITPPIPSPYERKATGLPGLLGIKGKTRDVLGTIGDAFLMQSGNAPMYAPHKRNEDLNEAMYGFADNPMEAMKRVAAIDPQMGMQMAQKMAEQQAAQEKALLEGRNTESQIAERNANLFRRVQGNVGGLLYGANEATYPGMREEAINIANKLGVDIAEHLPEQYDENAINAFVNMGVGDPDKLMDNERDAEYDAARLEDYDQSRELQERNVNSQIGSRAVRDSHSAARVAQGDRRTRAYESRVANQNSRPSRSSGGGSRSSGSASLEGVPKEPGVYEQDGIRVRRTRDGKLERIN